MTNELRRGDGDSHGNGIHSQWTTSFKGDVDGRKNVEDEHRGTNALSEEDLPWSENGGIERVRSEGSSGRPIVAEDCLREG